MYQDDDDDLEELKRGLIEIARLYGEGKNNPAISLMMLMPTIREMCSAAIGHYCQAIEDAGSEKSDFDKRTLFLNLMATHLGAVMIRMVSEIKKHDLFEFIFDGIDIEEDTSNDWKVGTVTTHDTSEPEPEEKKLDQLWNRSDDDPPITEEQVQDFFKELGLP